MNTRSKGEVIPNSGKDLTIPPELESDPRWRLVQRIAQSSQFHKSARLRDFLLYICRTSLTDHRDEISEQQIGVRVFGRAADYNASEDNIVRSQARLLRMKLESYFSSEGKDEPLVLLIPKGAYIPEFVAREEAPSAVVDAPPPPLRTSPAVWLLGSACAVLAVALAALWISTRPQTPAASGGVTGLLWSRMFTSGQPTLLVIPDHTYALLQEVEQRNMPLSGYVTRAYPPEPPASPRAKQLEELLPRFKIRRYTTFDSVSSAVRILELSRQYPGKVAIRYARDLTQRDLAPGNVILVGRKSTNPWVELYENRLNFRFESDLANHRVMVRNVTPRPGEQNEYTASETSGVRTVYAAVAFLPNLNGAGQMLLIGGVSTGSQESAAEFITTDRLFGPFAEQLRKTAGGELLPHFEVLIQTTTIEGIAGEPKVLGYRILKS
ncbi:MAG: hypothetical protein K2X35_16310 [Bryobacteraceae bacterium]|nr:hypothetical protein [Bryobacteraceae bacterium]